MKVLSIRCSNNDYTFCVISGMKESPAIEATGHVAFPAGFSDSEALKWLHQEMEELLRSHTPEKVVIKGTEPMVKRSNALEARIRNEAIISLAACQAGCAHIQKKVKATIAKDLGLKGRGKYLDTELDTSPVSGFECHTTKEQEAILAGWSCLD